jgi:hypothetical protein
MKPDKEVKRTMADSFVADDVLREVWRVRDEISASYDHDIERHCADLRKRQLESGHRVVDLSKSYRTKPAEPACAREVSKKGKK